MAAIDCARVTEATVAPVRCNHQQTAANCYPGFSISRQTGLSHRRGGRNQRNPKEEQGQDPALAVNPVARTKGKTTGQSDPNRQSTMGHIISGQFSQDGRRKRNE
jgi:hypothetical protein